MLLQVALFHSFLWLSGSIFKYFLLGLEIPESSLLITRVLEAQREKRTGVGRSSYSGVNFHLIPLFQFGSLFLHVPSSATPGLLSTEKNMLYYLQRKISSFLLGLSRGSVG